MLSAHLQGAVDCLWWKITFLLIENWTIIELSLFHVKEIRVWDLTIFLRRSLSMVLRVGRIGENLRVKANYGLETFLRTTIQRLLLRRILKTYQRWLVAVIHLSLLWWSNCDWIWNLDKIADGSDGSFTWRDHCHNSRSESHRGSLTHNDRLFGKWW